MVEVKTTVVVNKQRETHFTALSAASGSNLHEKESVASP